jgi:DNA-binding transcriptional ArsR family regulator
MLRNFDTIKIADLDPSVQQKIFRMQCDICRSLAHPVRLQIVDRLNRGEASAAELLAMLGISKGNLSKHMSMLVHSGIVESLRRGRRIFYQLTDPEIHKACSIMRKILYHRLKQGGNRCRSITHAPW